MSGIYEMTMAGKVVKEFKIPGGYHHDQFEMPDGNLLILTEDLRSATVEDMCVLVDRETGAESATTATPMGCCAPSFCRKRASVSPSM